MVAIIEQPAGEQRKEFDWDWLKKVIALGGIAVCAGILIYLCWVYGPVLIVSWLPCVVAAAMKLINQLRNILQPILPELVIGALGLAGIGTDWVVSKAG